MALCKALKGRTLFAKTQWHFVTGMGLSHPIENGMAWHPTLGVPYLTGAAVKGMLRAWIEVWDTNDDEQLQKERLQQWFGSDDKNGISTQAGSLIFFDALPTEAPTLGIDIMTPHGGKWYAEGQLIEKSNDVKESEKLPADWHNPVPIPFLVVKHASLQFCVAPRNKKAAQEVDIDSVYHALQHALEWIGAGAKTAVGYGRFEIDIPREKDITDKKAQQLKAQQEKVDMEKAKAALSPLAYEFHQHAKKEQWEVNKDKFWQQGVMEGWLDRLEADPNAELRKTIEKLMNQYFKNVMDNPDAVKGRRKKPVHKKRVQTLAKRLIKLR
jgi:CRISPR-associated protein Cmr6